MKSRKATITLKKSLRVRLYTSNDKVTIRYPNQTIGTVALLAPKADGTEVILKQWELQLLGETLKVMVVK